MYLIVDDDIVVIKYMYVQNLVIFLVCLDSWSLLTLSVVAMERVHVCVFSIERKNDILDY